METDAPSPAVPLAYQTPPKPKPPRTPAGTLFALPFGFAIGGLLYLLSWYWRYRVPIPADALYAVLYWTLGLDQFIAAGLLRILIRARRKITRVQLTAIPAIAAFAIGASAGWLRWLIPQYVPRLATRGDLQPLWLLLAPAAVAVLGATALIYAVRSRDEPKSA